MRLAPAARAALASSVLAFAVFLAPARALAGTGSEEENPDGRSIAALEEKAREAAPRDRCFLYARLVHARIELASRLLAAGNSDQAWATLRRVQEEMERIHPDAAEKDRRLKEAELLLEQTGHRLQQILAAASFEDRPVVEATLARVDQLQSQTMMQVFEK